jgi:hypothetical protein
MALNELYLDKRLQEKSLRDGKLDRKALDTFIGGLNDGETNLLQFDEEGEATNLPEVTLKELEIKTAEPEPYAVLEPTDLDSLLVELGD